MQPMEIDPLIYLSPGKMARAGQAAFKGLPFCLATGADARPRCELLERATLAIVEAGAGLLEDCARAGVPVLVYAGDGEGERLVRAVEETGAGLRLAEGDLEAARLRALAGRVMADPKYCRAAEALRERLRQEGEA